MYTVLQYTFFNDLLLEFWRNIVHEINLLSLYV